MHICYVEKRHKNKPIFINYKKYLSQCDKIKQTDNPSLATLQRTIRPYCRTTLLNKSFLTFYLKGMKSTVSIMVLPKENNTYYFLIKCNKTRNYEYTLSCLSIKELMYKINHKYNLLKPVE